MLRNTIASAIFFASVVLADYTFMTFPAANSIVQTNRPLTIKWEVRTGTSPESPNTNAPAMLSAVLGTHDANNAPVLYYPPLNGLDNNIPLTSGQFQWNWDLNAFTTPVAPRGINGNQFFVQLTDNQGYISSGQPFRINEIPGSIAPSAVPVPDAATTPSANPTKPNPSTSTGTNADSKPTTPTNSTPKSNSAASPSDSVIESAAVKISSKLAVAAAAAITCVGGALM